jgi:simple sugar transport system permease protein
MKLPEFLDTHVVVLLVLMVVVGAWLGIVRPEIFLSEANFQSMLLQSSVIGLLSLAVAVTLLTGGIDLSINAASNLAAILTAIFLSALANGSAGFPPVIATPIALAIGICVGILCGLLNGLLIAILGYSPILATLGTMTLFTGIGTVITGGRTLFGVSAFSMIGRGTVSGVPLPALIFLAAGIVLAFVLHGRRFGFNVYLYGANEAAARFSGIKTRKAASRR